MRQQTRRPAEHISSGEWKRFEVRMRRRRIERLIGRAETALAEGKTDELSKTLDEARQLDPGLNEIAALEKALASMRPPSLDAQTLSTVECISLEDYLRKVVVAAATIALAIGASELWIIRGPVLEQLRSLRASEETPELSIAAPSETPEQAASVETPQAASTSTRVQVETVEARSVQPMQLLEATATSGRAAEPASQIPAASQVTSTPITNAGAANAAPDVREPDPSPVKLSDTAPPKPVETPAHKAIEASAPRQTDTATVPALNDAAGGAPPEARNGGGTMVPEPNSAPMKADHPRTEVAAPGATEDIAVRGVLNRYAAAYSRLDASAAQEVWPAVNRLALERAFEGLASQQLLLDHCNVDVRGETARATCAGSTTWSPKIGNGGNRTEARNWTFQLAKAGTAWQIVSARVQNR